MFCGGNFFSQQTNKQTNKKFKFRCENFVFAESHTLGTLLLGDALDKTTNSLTLIRKIGFLDLGISIVLLLLPLLQPP